MKIPHMAEKEVSIEEFTKLINDHIGFKSPKYPLGTIVMIKVGILKYKTPALIIGMSLRNNNWLYEVGYVRHSDTVINVASAREDEVAPIGEEIK